LAGTLLNHGTNFAEINSKNSYLCVFAPLREKKIYLDYATIAKLDKSIRSFNCGVPPKTVIPTSRNRGKMAKNMVRTWLRQNTSKSK
jgi:hypothetical protein